MEKIHEEIKKSPELKVLLKILKIVGIIIVVVLVFEAGITVGFNKASFGKSWGEHYTENFGFGFDDQPMMGRIGMMGHFPNANGAIGKILKIALPNIIVQDKGNTEKALLITDDTRIQKGGDTLLMSDLKIDDFVVVIGAPDDNGVIDAKLIRIVPSPGFLK